jgi:hypothetical protein
MDLIATISIQDTLHNGTQNNDNQHNGLNFNDQQKGL